MGYIFILRHGPTTTVDNNDEKILDKQKFKKVIPHIVSTISKYCYLDVIYTSPIDRCIETAKMLNKYLNTDIQLKNDLLRCTDAETCDARLKEVYKFGHTLTHTKNKNILIVTHSSVVSGIIGGLLGYEIEKLEKKKSSISIYDRNNGKFILINHSFFQPI